MQKDPEPGRRSSISSRFIILAPSFPARCTGTAIRENLRREVLIDPNALAIKGG